MARYWRDTAGARFYPEKDSATGSSGMVVTNHPLASAAGVEMLAAGGNAVDAAVAALFALSVVEPMMVGIFGAGWTMARFSDGRTLSLDGYANAPLAAHASIFQPVSSSWPDYLETEGRENAVGYRSVGTPGSLKAWTELLASEGRLDLDGVIAPAIRLARGGFTVSEYLYEQISQHATDLRNDPAAAAIFMQDDAPLTKGATLRQPDLAQSLEIIATLGADALYDGPLGKIVVDAISRAGGILSAQDLRSYSTVLRSPVTGKYRGFEVVAPPPPSAGGVHLIQMLQILEGFNLKALGFGTADGLHLIAEACQIAFADRTAHLGDPDSTAPPVEWLTSRDYANYRRKAISMRRRGNHGAGAAQTLESPTTTHVTTADSEGTVVAMTQTINSVFGAKVVVPGTGLLLNNTMALFDPHPGQPNSVASGRRVLSSMCPTIVIRDGQPAFALGTPGGARIFAAVLQAIVNVIDHGMSLQEAVEAPRIWTQGQELEVEDVIPVSVRDELTARGHQVTPVRTVAGGMNGVAFNEQTLIGAACWRADGVAMGIGGGPARPGIRFHPDTAR